MIDLGSFRISEFVNLLLYSRLFWLRTTGLGSVDLCRTGSLHRCESPSSRIFCANDFFLYNLHSASLSRQLARFLR